MSKNMSILIGIVAVVGFGFYFFAVRQKKIVEPPADTYSAGQAAQEQVPQNNQNDPGDAVNVLPAGLKIDVLKEGTGSGAKSGNTVTVHYVGTLLNGKKFDSSRDRGEPFSLQLGAGLVIQGWELGLLGMKAGEMRRLTIPPELGYGSRGAGSVIPPDSVLVFEVEMISIE